MTTTLEHPAHLDGNPTIGEIAVRLPGATAVFRRLKLDFCCGGNVPLAQAAQDKGIDLQALLAELSTLTPATADESLIREPGALIEHILARYHQVHRAQLPELIRMAHRVEAVHRSHPAVPAGLGDALERMEAELIEHMEKEEQVLFPMLTQGRHPMAKHPIAMMRHEHTEHGKVLDNLDRLTHDMQPPSDACNTWRALYVGLAQLKDDLIAHIHLENNVLFPQFESTGCGSGCGCA